MSIIDKFIMWFKAKYLKPQPQYLSGKGRPSC